VQRIASYPKITVTEGGRGVCAHVGSRLLADVRSSWVDEAFDAAVGGGGGDGRRMTRVGCWWMWR
jgi:hypothetical protein